MLYIVNQPSSEAKVGQYKGGIAPTQPTTVKPTTQPTTAPTPTTQPTTSSVSDKYTMTFTDNIDIPSDATYVIFNNGSSQTVDIPVTGSAKFYISGSSNGKYTVNN